MATKFFLILSATTSPFQYELNCAISGDANGWLSTYRLFASRSDVEAALRSVSVLPPIGPNQLLDAAASNIPVAFSLGSASPAITLQILHRVDPQAKRERTMVTFNDLNGSFPFHTAHYEREHPIVVGETLQVDTPMGKRSVEVLEITKNEVVPYGSDDTRRNLSVKFRF
jgi:hypothetical protein